MAGSITIPQGQRPAIQELARLTDEAYDALRECLKDGPICSVPNDLAERTSKAVLRHTGLGGQIVGLLIGLRSLVDTGSMSMPEVAAGVVADVKAKQLVPEELQSPLLERLSELVLDRIGCDFS